MAGDPIVPIDVDLGGNGATLDPIGDEAETDDGGLELEGPDLGDEEADDASI